MTKLKNALESTATYQQNTMSNNKYIPFLWLIIGTILMMFIAGRWTILISAWLAPIFILRFMRLQKLRWAIPGCIISLVIAVCISYGESIPATGVVYMATAAAMGIVFCVPYIVDRLFCKKVSGFTTTFLFPLSYTAWEYFMAQVHPYPTFGSIAYSQYGNLPITQIISITGMWGLIFLITWFSSSINWAWENDFEFHRIKKGTSVYLALLCFVLLFGGFSLAFFAPKTKTVHVASLVIDKQTEYLYKTINRNHDNPNPPSTDITLTRNTFSKILNVFLDRSRQQARAGAQIVIWSEYSIYTFSEDEEEFIEQAKKTAKEEHIYLMLGLIVITDRFPEVYGQNKDIFIDPDGKILWKYLKSYPVMGGETMISGDGIIPFIDTPFGKIGSAICFDMDHISFVHQAGKKGVDIFLVPAIDWKGIDPFHTNMVSFRAIENGFSIVRCCSDGLSAAYDYQGRTISASDYFGSADNAMISEIPIRGVRTVYSVVGDLFAWMCIAGLAFIIVWIIFKTRRNYV